MRILFLVQEFKKKEFNYKNMVYLYDRPSTEEICSLLMMGREKEIVSFGGYPDKVLGYFGEWKETGPIKASWNNASLDVQFHRRSDILVHTNIHHEPKPYTDKHNFDAACAVLYVLGRPTQFQHTSRTEMWLRYDHFKDGRMEETVIKVPKIKKDNRWRTSRAPFSHKQVMEFADAQGFE